MRDDELAALLLRVENMTIEYAQRKLSAEQLAAIQSLPEFVRIAGRKFKLTPEARQWARNNDPRETTEPIANRLYKLLLKIIEITADEALEAARLGGLEVTPSQVQGWRRHHTSRSHVKMTIEQYEAVMNGIVLLDRQDHDDAETDYRKPV